MYQMLTLKIIFLITCFCPLLCSSSNLTTNKTVDPETTEVVTINSSPETDTSSSSESVSISVSLETSSATPTIPPLKNSICNMSLKALGEQKEVLYRKCVCNGFQGAVDCAHLGIIEIPKDISFPQDIHIARLQGNKIKNVPNDVFYSAREVTEMDLSYNEIDFISITAFKAFKRLVKLDLSHNRIWNLPRGMFEGLAHLQRLDLSFNDLISVFPKHLANLVELKELFLKNNPLEELEPKHFEHLENLEVLDLESTLLKVIPDHVFHFTPRLKILKLGNNQLTTVPTEALRVLDHLNTLDLSGNPIEVIPPQAFHGLSRLGILYLERMPHLKSIEDYAFGDMIHLQELHCSYNFKLTDIAPYAFTKISNNEKVSLSQLFLRQNELSKIPQTLLNWNQGMEMHLRDNPLHCDCYAEWMVNLRIKNNFQDHARCSSPAEFEGLSLSKLKGQEMTCGLHLTDIVLIISGVIMGLLLIVLLMSFLYWRRNYRGYSKPNFYKVNKNVNDIDYNGGDDGI